MKVKKMKLDPSRQTYFALFFSASANLFVHGEEKSSSVLHCFFPTSAKSPLSPSTSVICNFSYYGSIVSASAYQAKKDIWLESRLRLTFLRSGKY